MSIQILRLFERVKSTCPTLSSLVQCHHQHFHRQQYSSSSKSSDLISIDLRKFTPDKIRNFAIVAHIDHGKSTLSDRLLELCGLISKDEQVKQYLDRLQIEVDRGITVKAQSVSLIHRYNEQDYLLNLIDTPGHVDFSYEVSRSIPVCDAAVLLVDATSGVQSETISHFNQVLLSDLTIVPVINKIDLKSARTDQVLEQMKRLFSIEPQEVTLISAKTGLNVDKLLNFLIEKVPSSKGDVNKPFQAMIFDCWHRPYLGVISLIHVRHGRVKVGDRVRTFGKNSVYEVRSLGVFHPNECSTNELSAGQVGYFSAHIHDTKELILGDLIVSEEESIESTEDFASNKPTLSIPKPKQMVYAGIYACDPSQTQLLKAALSKLLLTDNGVSVDQDISPALGHGYRLGFLGILHLDVFCQRLEQEFDTPTVITAPTVPYKVKIKGQKNIKQYGSDIVEVKNPLKLPDVNIIEYFEEPMIRATIISPEKYLNLINNLSMERRGQLLTSYYIDQETLLIQFRFPLSEVIVDFYDELKGMTSGFASFDYEPDGYERVDAVRLDFLINGKCLDEMTLMVPKSKARDIGKKYCLKLKQQLPRQQFKIAIQAAVGKKVIAREDVSAYRKDVLQKIKSGTDLTRKKKLLAHQAEAKQRMRSVGNVVISRQVLIDVLKK